jgi:hypothetical protein
MDPAALQVLQVSIPAIVSLVVAVIAMVTSFATSRKLASSNEELAGLTSRLRDEESALNARRHYEYEALKRLYTECEPLLFQIFELAEDAESRVQALARECRQDNLRRDGSGWLGGEGYYFNSTVYRFFAPLAAIRILQRRLTAVDLALDSRLETQYRLLRMLYRSMSDDHALAERSPVLPYEPDRADPDKPDRESRIAAEPKIYVRQGLYRGTLDRLAESMIILEGDIDRVMSFGEFLQFKQDEESQLYRAMPQVRILLFGFHPLTRPVLWRVLVTQKLIYDALRTSRDADRTGPVDIPSLIPTVTDEYLATLDWRQKQSEVTTEIIKNEISAARAYIVDSAQA